MVGETLAIELRSIVNTPSAGTRMEPRRAACTEGAAAAERGVKLPAAGKLPPVEDAASPLAWIFK